MGLLNIVFCVVLQNLVSPAFGDIDPKVVHYNPVAAYIAPELNTKCPGALVWVGRAQVIIGSNKCVTFLLYGDVFAGDDEKRILWSETNSDRGVGFLFPTGYPTNSFGETSLIMPGFLQKHKDDARNDLPITISNGTWGPHHEVYISDKDVDGDEITLNFSEVLTANECPDGMEEWGPAMRPSTWGVPLIVGVFKKYAKREIEGGKCRVSLVYTSTIPAVEWIEETVKEFTQEYLKFDQPDKKPEEFRAYMKQLKSKKVKKTE